MHTLLASPFLADTFLLRPGDQRGVAIPASSYEALRTAAADGGPMPAWVHDAASQAWGLEVEDGPVSPTILVRGRSPYGFGRASWEINLNCDYNCAFCYLGDKPKAGLPWEEKQRLLEMLRDAGVLWLQITGGEALVDPQFAAAYEYANQLGMMIQLSTNGSQLHKERVIELLTAYRPYRIAVSLYGGTEDTYEAVTKNRGSFARFERGLAAAREAGLPVRLNIVVTDQNAGELDEMVALAERHGFPHQVFTNMSPTIGGKADPLALQADEYLAKRQPFKGCNAGRTFFHVNPHGHASICKIGRDPNVNLMTEGIEALPRLGGIAEDSHLRVGGCSGCQLSGTCWTCRPLAKLYQDAEADRSLYCQHG